MHYGLVLALQVHIPDAAMELVQSVSPDEPEPASDAVSGLFRISFSDVQTTLAIDEDVHDMRSEPLPCLRQQKQISPICQEHLPGLQDEYTTNGMRKRSVTSSVQTEQCTFYRMESTDVTLILSLHHL